MSKDIFRPVEKRAEMYEAMGIDPSGKFVADLQCMGVGLAGLIDLFRPVINAILAERKAEWEADMLARKEAEDALVKRCPAAVAVGGDIDRVRTDITPASAYDPSVFMWTPWDLQTPHKSQEALLHGYVTIRLMRAAGMGIYRVRELSQHSFIGRGADWRLATDEEIATAFPQDDKNKAREPEAGAIASA